MSLFKSVKKLLFINPLINRPFFFNNLRFLVTGDQKEIKNFVSHNLKKFNCKSVIDICCGTGDFVQLNRIRYTGIDINKSFISYAGSKYKNNNVSFMPGNALNLPFSNGSFDAALLISALHHFSDSETLQLLKEAKRVTKKLVIIVDLIPHPKSPLKRFFVLLDQGDYVRSEKNKEKIISKFLKIHSTKLITAKMAEQYAIIAFPHE